MTRIAPVRSGSRRRLVQEQESNERQFSQFSYRAALGLAFCLLNTWTACAASLSVVLGSGGPVAMLYGMILSGAGSWCMASSLGEIWYAHL
jgi:hypothetical protein